MTGFYMKLNTGLKWIKQTSFENQLVNLINTTIPTSEL